MAIKRIFPALVAAACTAHAFASAPIVIDAAGRGIGFYLGEPHCVQTIDIAVMTSTSYVACINRDTGWIEPLVATPTNGDTYVHGTYYSDSTCSGTPLVIADGLDFYGGFIVRGDRALLSAPPGEEATETALYSAGDSSAVCEDWTNSPMLEPAVPGIVSNFAVTRLMNVAYKLPLRVVVADESILDDEIFVDALDNDYLQ